MAGGAGVMRRRRRRRSQAKESGTSYSSLPPVMDRSAALCMYGVEQYVQNRSLVIMPAYDPAASSATATANSQQPSYKVNTHKR